MLKPTKSQQMESETIRGILQQVESDATSPSLEKLVSFETIPIMTQGGGQVAEQDAHNDEDQEQAMGNA